MKRKTTLKLLLKIVIGIAILNANAFKAISQTLTFSKPGHCQEFQHNGTNWVHISNSTFTYNSNGELTFQLYTDPVSNQNLIKREVAYDPNGNEKSHLVYQWQNNNWSLRNGQRDSLIYDSNNRVAIRISRWYNNGVWEGEKFENTYDSNGNQIEEIRSVLNGSTWDLTGKTTTTLNNGTITEKLYELRNGTTWRNYQKEIYVGWHILNVQPASYTLQGFNSSTNQWFSPTRFTTTLTTNGGSITLRERFQINSWINISRSTLYFDSRGNRTGNLTENFTNGTWVPSSENQIIITYNSLFDITEKTYRWPNLVGGQVSGPVIDQYKEVYSNFQYFTRALGTSENQQAELALSVYPNPATDKIQIALAENKPQALTATVKGITGKTWQTQSFEASETKQLNIESLPKGIYLLQLQTETGSTVKRIVKQ